MDAAHGCSRRAASASWYAPAPSPSRTSAWLWRTSSAARSEISWLPITNGAAHTSATAPTARRFTRGGPSSFGRSPLGALTAVAGPVRSPRKSIPTTDTAVSSHIQSTPAIVR